MTTRITVTTGDGGLLERNAQQQAAARQAALVKAQAEQAAATGAEQQRQRRIASGLDPATGRPLPSTGATSRLTRIDQEPAAFRTARGDVWICYCDTAPELIDVGQNKYLFYRSLQGRNQPLLPNEFFYEEPAWVPRTGTTPTGPFINDAYSQHYTTGGPFNLAYIRSFLSTQTQAFDDTNTGANNTFITAPITRSGLGGWTQQYHTLSTPSNAFTLEVNHIAYPRANHPSGVASCEIFIEAVAENGDTYSASLDLSGTGVQLDRVSTFAGLTPSVGSGFDLANVQLTFPYGTVRTAADTWTQTTLVFGPTKLMIFSAGVKIVDAPLSQPVPKGIYSVWWDMTPSALTGGPPDGFGFDEDDLRLAPYGWCASRFSSFARYSDNYGQSPLNRP